jgi:hypothetical protein
MSECYVGRIIILKGMDGNNNKQRVGEKYRTKDVKVFRGKSRERRAIEDLRNGLYIRSIDGKNDSPFRRFCGTINKYHIGTKNDRNNTLKGYRQQATLPSHPSTHHPQKTH